MNKLIFIKKMIRQATLLLLTSLVFTGFCQAQAPQNEGLSKSELDAINNQPIAKTIKVQQVEGPDQLQPSFELKDSSGTEIREYREKDQPVDVEVNSNLGTRYNMSRPTDPTPNIPDQYMNRVPSIKVPF
jgi:hypothetical protein